jgi:hypothetical protein
MRGVRRVRWEGGLIGPCARGTRHAGTDRLINYWRCSFDARTMGPIQATLKPVSA